jgi:predicted SnoaL-like aldol condensation-catalyzing enzyme
MLRTISLMLFAASVLAVGVASAQQPAAPFNPYIPNPDPGCTATPAQLEANKKVALAFFTTTGAERVALADVTYIQHNPAFIKGAREANMSDFDYFKARFGGAPAAGRQGGGGGGGGRQGGAAGPQAPPTQPFEFAVAQCDIVFALRKQHLQDPTMPPGNFYEAFSFDMFRVQRGKLVEHWDMAEIQAPAAGRQGGGAAPAGGRGN